MALTFVWVTESAGFFRACLQLVGVSVTPRPDPDQASLLGLANLADTGKWRRGPVLLHSSGVIGKGVAPGGVLRPPAPHLGLNDKLRGWGMCARGGSR